MVFGKINTDDEQQLAAAFDIDSIPTLMIFRDKVLLFRQAGALPPAALDDVVAQAKALDMEKSEVTWYAVPGRRTRFPIAASLSACWPDPIATEVSISASATSVWTSDIGPLTQPPVGSSGPDPPKLREVRGVLIERTEALPAKVAGVPKSRVCDEE